MRMTRILWAGVPVLFLVAIGAALWGPGPKKEPEVWIRQIVIKADPSDPDDIERARRETKEIREFLEKGANFAQLAINRSEAPNAPEGGDMGWNGRGILPEHLEDVAFQLEPGEYSEIISNQVGDFLVFRILYVEDRRNF
jgi:parvulin-like peptidyl-prolyl isomerase